MTSTSEARDPDPAHDDGEPAPFTDAEAWLAARGIRREPIRVDAQEPDTPAAGAPTGTPSGVHVPGPGDDPAAQPGEADDVPEVSARDALRLAQDQADATIAAADEPTGSLAAGPRLEDEVTEAVAFVRRSTSMTPQSEQRVRAKLEERGWSAVVVDQAIDRARRERLVDDQALVAALVEERRAKGHAPARIRRDLRERGFPDGLLDTELATAEAQDLEAAAFAVAREKAERVTGLGAESAFRRVVGHVLRRGYPDGLARKVAREAVFATREDERSAER